MSLDQFGGAIAPFDPHPGHLPRALSKRQPHPFPAGLMGEV